MRNDTIDWDADEDEAPKAEHNPNCRCDDCDPIDVVLDPEEDIDSPGYHAPNRCDDPNCLFPQCQDDGAVGSERFPGEDIWWKTLPDLDALVERIEELKNKNK